MTPMILGLSGEEVVAWLAAVAAAASLGKQTIDALRKRKKEQSEVEQALEHAPEVRKQLELGNVGEAVGHLNVIMESQATYIVQQDARITGLVAQVSHLEDRNQALEMEAQGWEAKYNAEVRAREALDRELQETKRVFGRRITALTDQLNARGKPPEDYQTDN